MKDDMDDMQDVFQDVIRTFCFWLGWPKDDPDWRWIYAVAWADHQEHRPLFQLFATKEQMPEKVKSYVEDLFWRKVGEGTTKTGPKIPLWHASTPEEQVERLVHRLIKEQGISVREAINQALRTKLEETDCLAVTLNRLIPRLDRDKLYENCSSNFGGGRRRKGKTK